jgi:hypothetical protein
MLCGGIAAFTFGWIVELFAAHDGTLLGSMLHGRNGTGPLLSYSEHMTGL